MLIFPNFVKTYIMVSVDEAFKIIQEVTEELEVIEIEVKNATGFVLAENCISCISFPPFDQSAMDGYAVCFDHDQREFKVIDEIKAGDSGVSVQLKLGEACRIFTGAMLPANTTAIVKQEDVKRDSDIITTSKEIEKGEHIRLCGEQINEGDIAVFKNTVLNPGAIGFLSTLGLKKISVFRKPKIAIIATGNELTSAGEKLEIGKIFESNTNTLLSALSVYGFKASAEVVEDSYDLIKEKIASAIKENDVVLITGGISVGDYDFVGRILNDLNVEEKFYKVRQKPGKPIFFGAKGETIVFALPGNPAAVLTSFYMYVLAALAELTGRKKGFLTHKKVQLITGFEKSPNLTFLLKGKVEGDHVKILPAQSSAMLSSFIEADCLVRLNENKTIWQKDEFVDVYIIQ